MKYSNEQLSRMVEEYSLEILIKRIPNDLIQDKELAEIWSNDNYNAIMEILDAAWLPEDDWEDDESFDEFDFDVDEFTDPEYTEDDDENYNSGQQDD